MADYTIQGKISATPQTTHRNKKQHNQSLETDSVKTPQAQLRPNYFHSWTRGSLAKQTANMRPQNKDTPQREHIHHLRTQPEDLTHDKRDAPTDTKDRAEASSTLWQK